MLRIRQTQPAKFLYVECPSCREWTGLNKVQTVYCWQCSEISPPWLDIIGDIEMREYYHLNPDAWF